MFHREIQGSCCFSSLSRFLLISIFCLVIFFSLPFSDDWFLLVTLPLQSQCLGLIPCSGYLPHMQLEWQGDTIGGLQALSHTLRQSHNWLAASLTGYRDHLQCVCCLWGGGKEETDMNMAEDMDVVWYGPLCFLDWLCLWYVKEMSERCFFSLVCPTTKNIHG